MKNRTRISKRLIASTAAAALLFGGAAATGLPSADAASASSASAPARVPTGANQGGFQSQGGQGLQGLQGVAGIDLLGSLAEILGVEQSELLAAVEGGTTLAEYAVSLGVTEASLLAQWESAIEAAVAEAVASGKLTEEQAEKALDGLADRLKELAESESLSFGGGPGMGMGQGGGQAYSVLELAAGILGVEASELQEALGEEQTLLEYAVSQGWTEEELLAQLTEAAEAAIAVKVTAGTLTQEQADKELEGLAEMLKRQIASTLQVMGGQPGRGQGQGQGQQGSGNNGGSSSGTGTGSGSGSSVELTDIGNHWAAQAIKGLVAKGIVQGDQNKKFNPGGTVTRETLATMLAKAFDLTASASSASGSATFSDVPSGRWSYSSVEAAKSLFSTSGGKFSPSTNSTRAEVVVALVKAIVEANDAVELLDSSSAEALLQQKFTDAASIPSASRVYVATAAQLGIVNGNTEGQFAADKTVTRAELAVMLTAALAALES
ncbi:S-layer homology domain-containing protein [Cohnella fermenti]|uniref:S-layer homology domain-containing protein n=1 Tax=Cohnella fermenti TaxID=2565925 RepID=A0A4S4C839_9BACL|nr:S-layer homology domain-containing protein [Cohnella fermenti]THF84172.1 S-layer homology domain-containing protein [Cohnella fermenti]